jgi:hypothetical protein
VIPDWLNNWICYDFMVWLIIPTHCPIGAYNSPRTCHTRAWILELSADGRDWTDIDRRGENTELNPTGVIRTLPVARGLEGHFIRPIKVGRTHAKAGFLCV